MIEIYTSIARLINERTEVAMFRRGFDTLRIATLGRIIGNLNSRPVMGYHRDELALHREGAAASHFKAK